MLGDVWSSAVLAPFVAGALLASVVTEFGLSNLIALAVIALGGFITLRLNIGSTWRANYEAEREARRLMEESRDVEREGRVKAEHELRLAEAKTDLSVIAEQHAAGVEKLARLVETEGQARTVEIVSGLRENARRFNAEFEGHERRAEERNRALLDAITEVTRTLELVAERLLTDEGRES